jgi:hypothetical protein
LTPLILQLGFPDLPNTLGRVFIGHRIRNPLQDPPQ